MNKTIGKPSKERMIHIRLDDETHRQLKVQAAQTGISIQRFVEALIHKNINNIT